MNKITISTGHPDAGRVYAEAYDAASAREEALREEVLVLKKGGQLLVGDRDALQQRLTAANRELEAALAHEDSMREELARYKSLFGQAQKAIDRLNELHPKRMGELAKRLSVAEHRAGELHKWVIKYRNVVASRRYIDNADRIELSRLDAALKTAAEGEGS